MHRFGLAAVLAAAVWAAAFVPTGSGGGAGPRGGLYGTVYVGPIVPVCRAYEPCDRPARVTLVFSRLGRDVARVRSGADGRYRVPLPPAIYAVRTLERIGIVRNIRPRTVKVRPGHFDRLDFFIDTGIR